MHVEQWPIERVIPYDRNPRINEGAVEAVARSLSEFGFRQCLVVDESDVLIVGHTRLKAAHKLGYKHVPVHVAKGLSPEQARAYRIADNQTASIAQWDLDLLPLELKDLEALNFDPSLLGFSDDALEKIMHPKGREGETDPDDVPGPPVEPITQQGDLWLLGNHRLLCGDSTHPGDVARLLDGQEIDLCFTSPPYAQQRDYGAAKEHVQDWNALMLGVFALLNMAKNGQVIVNLGLVHRENEWQPYWEHWLDWMREQGWRRFGWYVWDQGSGLPGDWNGRLAPSFEFLFHFNKEARRPHKTVDKKPESVRVAKNSTFRKKDGSLAKFTNEESSLCKDKIQDSVVRVRRAPQECSSHPATFPVGLAGEIIASWTSVGELVHEPFSGAGTTIIAAEQLNRRCYAMEIDPVYCDIAVKRWEKFTGKEATRLEAVEAQ